jgi:hypothetical protein
MNELCIYIYVIRCMNYVLYICYELLICSLEICFKLEIDVDFYPAVIGELTLDCPSLLWPLVATGG